MTEQEMPKLEGNESQRDRIIKLQEWAKDKGLFKDMIDPSEWQHEIRSEWERDFTKLNPPIHR